MSDDVLRTEMSDSVATVVIDRAPVNALAPAEWEGLASIFQTIDANLEIRAVVLSGVEGRFCAGADIRVLTEPDPDADRASMLTVVGVAAKRVRGCRVPVIAAIDGPAHGGGLELALACDIRIASATATFAAAGVNMGLLASVRSLRETIGDAAARQMLLTAERISADQALGWDLITEVVDDPVARAHSLARGIAAKPPLAVEATKRGLNVATTLTPGAHDEFVKEQFRDLANSADHAEAITAFLEKRTGEFKRR